VEIKLKRYSGRGRRMGRTLEMMKNYEEDEEEEWGQIPQNPQSRGNFPVRKIAITNQCVFLTSASNMHQSLISIE
jgi:hypothetical protein